MRNLDDNGNRSFSGDAGSGMTSDRNELDALLAEIDEIERESYSRKSPDSQRQESKRRSVQRRGERSEQKNRRNFPENRRRVVNRERVGMSRERTAESDVKNFRKKQELRTSNSSEKEKEGRTDKKRASRFLCMIMAIAFIFGTAFLTVASIVAPDASFSEEENRVLAEMPKFSMQGVIDKEYMTQLENYTSDQFFLRDWWISLKVQCDLLMGKKEFNGVYLGDEKYLMQIPAEPNEKQVAHNLDAMNQFAKRNENLNINTMIVPNAAYIMQDYLPKGAPVRNQSEDMAFIAERLTSEIGYIDVTETFKKNVDEGLYYKTDHHWTTKGAAYAFQAAAPKLGLDNVDHDFDVYTVTTDFSGTLASKSGYHKIKDTIEVYAPAKEVEYLVRDSDNEEERPTVYNLEALKEKDKYQVFLGGNHATVNIQTAVNTNKKLVIFKDSYANCFVPFLLPYYNEIIMIDPRYYYDNIDTLISNKGITDVLFLYNMDTFMTDNSIAGILAEE